MNTPYASDSAPQNYSYPKGIASVPFASFMRINKYSYDDGMAAVGKAQNDVLGSVQNSGLVKNVTEGLADSAQWLYGDKTGGNNYLAMEEKEMLAKFKENTENIHKPKYEGTVKYTIYNGTTTQTADQDLISETGGVWTASDKLQGVAYAVVRLKFEPEVFGNTGIPQVNFDVVGKKTRSTTSGGTTYKVFSDNPADCIADYLILRWRAI